MDREGKGDAWTTAVQGDLDQSGEVFAKMRKLWQSEEAKTMYASLNPDHGEFGTHSRLLWSAAKASEGDILEMGHIAPRGAKKEEAFGGVILKSERPSGALFTNSGPPFFTVESKIEVLSPLGTSFH